MHLKNDSLFPRYIFKASLEWGIIRYGTGRRSSGSKGLSRYIVIWQKCLIEEDMEIHTVLLATQSFLPHAAHSLSKQLLNIKLLEKARLDSWTLWSGKWLFSLGAYNVNTPFAQSYLTYGVAVKPSTIKHEREKGCAIFYKTYQQMWSSTLLLWQVSLE